MKAYLITTIILYCFGILSSIKDANTKDGGQNIRVASSLIGLGLVIWASILLSRI